MSEKNLILIVDDESTNLLALNKLLAADYAVCMAKNGAHALELARRDKPDLILLDVLMPDMDGFETLARLKEESSQSRDIPVILVTGLGNEEDEEKGFLLGAADYVRKPFRPVVVRARVETQIELARLRKALAG